MLAVVFWSSFINADFSPNYHGYLLFYLLIRILLIMMYWRVSKINPASVPISKRLSIGFSMGLMVSLSSLLFESPVRYFIMYAGISIEILTPLLSRDILKTVSVKSHHLPERYGLLTIILLGESVIIMATKLNEVPWTTNVIESIILGFLILSATWWLYFNLMEKNMVGKKIQTGQNIVYGHLFIYTGLSAIAVFIGYSIKPELTLLSHNMLFVIGFVAFSVGLVSIFGLKVMVKKDALIPLLILFLSAGVTMLLQVKYRM